MKRVICAAIIGLCASAMIACDDTTKGVSRISVGDKSKMDSLSYCVGFINSVQFCNGMADVKLDWNLTAEACKEALLIPTDKDDKDIYEKASSTSVIFFDSVRIKRLTQVRKDLQGDDPNKTIDMGTVLPKIDIFESAEEREKISWAIGYDMGYNFRIMPYNLQAHWFIKGLLDGTNPANNALALQIQAYMSNYHEVVWPLLNAEASANWLSEISKKLNVKSTKSGLLYRISDEGDQQNKPNIHSTVTLNYETLCHDGRVFATTYRKGIPAEVKVERMIKGWAEGVQLIGKGGKITIWMPANLAYGEDGNRFIGPNEALQMNIELLDVKTPNVQVQSIEWDTPAKDKK